MFSFVRVAVQAKRWAIACFLAIAVVGVSASYAMQQQKAALLQSQSDTYARQLEQVKRQSESRLQQWQQAQLAAQQSVSSMTGAEWDLSEWTPQDVAVQKQQLLRSDVELLLQSLSTTPSRFFLTESFSLGVIDAGDDLFASQANNRLQLTVVGELMTSRLTTP